MTMCNVFIIKLYVKKGIFDNILSSRKRILTHISQIMDANVHVSATLVAANIYS